MGNCCSGGSMIPVVVQNHWFNPRNLSKIWKPKLLLNPCLQIYITGYFFPVIYSLPPMWVWMATCSNTWNMKHFEWLKDSIYCVDTAHLHRQKQSENERHQGVSRHVWRITILIKICNELIFSWRKWRGLGEDDLSFPRHLTVVLKS